VKLQQLQVDLEKEKARADELQKQFDSLKRESPK
jgi:hypothetical protein